MKIWLGFLGLVIALAIKHRLERRWVETDPWR